MRDRDIKYAQETFQALKQEALASHCTVLLHENGTLVDAGWDVPGGWMAAKRVLDGLMSGQGQVSFAHRQMDDGAQLPVVEVFSDNPLGLTAAFTPDEQGTFGIAQEDGYVLGVSLQSPQDTKKIHGQIVTAPINSLFAGVLTAGSVLSVAVLALQAQGVEDILWGWSSCPLAPMTHDNAETLSRRTAMEEAEGSVSLWVRGEEEAIRQAVTNFPAKGFCVHELVTACTYSK